MHEMGKKAFEVVTNDFSPTQHYAKLMEIFARVL
jgi:hypothetical protein